MKKTLLILLFCAAAFVTAQNISVGNSVRFSYEHDLKTSIKLYTNGVLFQTLTPAEITPIQTNGALITFVFDTKPILTPGKITFHVTAVFDGVESDPSNTNMLSIKPRPPQSATVGK